MYPLYKDLRTKLGTPLWHDATGVPRYDAFHPDLLGIYDKWAALFLVECQSCGKLFKCARGLSLMSGGMSGMTKIFEDIKTAEGALKHLIMWGDAPWHNFEGDETAFDGQCAGTTMSTSVVDILEVWHCLRSEWLNLTIEPQMLTEFCEDADHGYERAAPTP